MKEASYWDRQRIPPTVGFEDLDGSQRAFCCSEPGNVRVLAPAGSGKTQTLLQRCAYLHKHSPGDRFLVVTFTRAASAELNKRLNADDFGGLSAAVEVRTLNSWGWHQVHSRSRRASLVTSVGEKAACVRDMRARLRDYPFVAKALKSGGQRRMAGILDHVDTLKNFGFRLEADCTVLEFLDHWERLAEVGSEPRLERLVEDLRKIGILSDPAKAAILRDAGGGHAASADVPRKSPPVELFERFFGFGVALFAHMFETERFTLEDQKYVALQYLRRDGDRSGRAGAYDHVLVDEFQDISPLDLELTRQIADRYAATLTIVGDDDQAIFEWRGGSPNYLLAPEGEFGRSFGTFVLERNYRSPANIVRSADRLIRNNTRRHPKRMEAVRAEDAEIVFLTRADAEGAVSAVIDQVHRFRDGCGPRDRMALLSRKRAQLVPFQILLADEGIRFDVADDLSLFLSRAFRNLIRLLEIRARRDDASVPAAQIVKDTLLLCREVTAGDRDERTLERIETWLKRRSPTSYEEAHEALRGIQGRIGSYPAYQSAVWKLFAASTVKQAIGVIRRRFEGLSQDFGKGATDIFYQDPPFFHLGAIARRFGKDFPAFLRILERAKTSASELKGEDERGVEEPYRPILLATALRAKGKEFHTVVILDANDGVWPSQMAKNKLEKASTRSEESAALAGLEEERRLFYVAMTRARTRLVVSWSGIDADQTPLAGSPYLAEAGLRPRDLPRALRETAASGREAIRRRAADPDDGSPRTSIVGPRLTSEWLGRVRLRKKRGRLKFGKLHPARIGPASLAPGRRGKGQAVGDAELAEVIGGGESPALEFKSTLRVNLVTKQRDGRIEHAALKTVAAFLNTEGGALVIGVDDGGRALGVAADDFANEDGMQQHLVNLARDRLVGAAAMTCVTPCFAEHEGRRVMVVTCRPSREPVWVRDGKLQRFFVRVGATTQELQPSDVYPYVSARFGGE